MRLKEIIKKKKQTKNTNSNNITLNDPFSNFNTFNPDVTGIQDPFSSFDDFAQPNQFPINTNANNKNKTKKEPHPFIQFLKKTRDTMSKISKKTSELLKGKPPVAVFKTYSDIVVFHEEKGIKIIVNGYEYAHYSEWDLKDRKWKKITVKEVLNSEYTGDKVEGRGFLLTKFIMPKTFLNGKMLYYEVSVYVGEFKGSLTKPVKIGEKYKIGGRVGINANLLVVIREYSLVNIGGKFVRKEHILYTGGKLSDDLMEFIKNEGKKKSLIKRIKRKAPELNPLEGTGETEEIIIDKESSENSTNDNFANDFGDFNLGLPDTGNNQQSDPFSDFNFPL